MRMTIRDVEEVTGVTRSRINNVENGKHRVLADAAVRLMYYYDILPGEIMVDPNKPVAKER